MKDYRIHRKSFREVLGIGEKLAPSFSATYRNRFLPSCNLKLMGHEWVRPYLKGMWTVIVKPAPTNGRRKSSAHRVYVICKCGREIPAGRLDQHAKACEHLD